MTVLRRGFSSALQDVVILSAVRTPIGAFRGALSSVSAIELGTTAVQAAVSRAGIKPEQVDEILLGNVISANLGQAPARQVALSAGLAPSTVCTTINKVCASGMKATTLAAQSIALHHSNIVVAGGTESMSQVPYYLAQARSGYGYGHQQVVDGVLRDGLWDPRYQIHMGDCAEETAVQTQIGRKEQDDYAIQSYKRAAAAAQEGRFKSELVPVKFTVRGKEVTVNEDEEIKKVDFAKLPTLKPAFKKEGGTITAANASKLNDGASALVLSSSAIASKLQLKPLAKIIAYADAERHPKEFSIAPALAIPKALQRAGLKIEQISLFEINEAFSVVACANAKLLGIDQAKLNVNGGGVSLGHPIGSSGARIIVTLVHQLKSGEFGVAGICNGGGGATAIVIQKL